MLDLKRQMAPIRDEIDDAVRKVIDECRFILGPEVEEFETAIAAYSQTAYAVGCASGTDALLLALRAAGAAPGGEVITTAYSFYATAAAIWRIGCRPVFVDIDPDTFNMNPKQIAGSLTPKTCAILPVHLFGQMCDMDHVRAIAGSVPVIEDAAQALGACWNGRPAGTWGEAACFSFFPSKNLGGFGDGGMVVTNTPEIAEQCRSLRVHGATRTYFHESVGYNSRLDTLQAAVLSVKLRYLDEWSKKRRRNARIYDDAFRETPVKSPVVKPEAESIYNQYVIRVDNREDVIRELKQRNIGHAVYYPVPLPLQPCFKDLGYQPGDFPEAERASADSLALPVFPELASEEIEQVIDAVLAAV